MEKKKILIVDDEMDMRIFMSTLFETSGYAPVAVRNGSDGIKKAREISPDLVILDVMMPGEGGATMFRALKTDDSLARTPVIMLSGVGKEAFLHYLKMLNIQADDPVQNPEYYMEKPPHPDKLLKTVQSLIG